VKASWPEVDRACGEAKRFLEEHSLQEACFRVLLGLREALNNAVKHGSGLDPAKSVQLELVLEPDLLRLRVRDEGAGFAWSERLRREPEVFADSGRGLLILQSYFDSLGFNEQGNEMVATLSLKGGLSGGSNAK
jgi:serine/threonine-protein kinase RsbW